MYGAGRPGASVNMCASVVAGIGDAGDSDCQRSPLIKICRDHRSRLQEEGDLASGCVEPTAWREVALPSQEEFLIVFLFLILFFTAD